MVGLVAAGMCIISMCTLGALNLIPPPPPPIISPTLISLHIIVWATLTGMLNGAYLMQS